MPMAVKLLTASTMTSWHHIHSALPQIPKIWAHQQPEYQCMATSMSFSMLMCSEWHHFGNVHMLLMCKWIHHHAVTTTLVDPELGVGNPAIHLRQWCAVNDTNVQWLRLRTHMEWFPHPPEAYTRCLVMFLWCGCAYGSIIMPLPPHLLTQSWDLGIDVVWQWSKTYWIWRSKQRKIQTESPGTWMFIQWLPPIDDFRRGIQIW